MAIPRKRTNSVTVIQEGPREVYTLGFLSEDFENLPTTGILTGSMAYCLDTGKTYLYHEDNGWKPWSIAGGGGGGQTDDITPYLAGTITNISNDKVTELRPYALCGISNANADVNFSFPEVTKFGNYAFGNSTYKSLALSAPKAANLGSSTFYGTTASVKTAVEFPAATTVSYATFRNCTAFSSVSLGAGCNYVGQLTFDGFSGDVIIESTSVPTLAAVNAFTNFSGSIYVLDNLVDQYKAAANWSTYADKILPISGR